MFSNEIAGLTSAIFVLGRKTMAPTLAAHISAAMTKAIRFERMMATFQEGNYLKQCPDINGTRASKQASLHIAG
ncbi:MAG: hypothetical protein WAO76_10900 [Georgfuchsia sp.]